MAKNVGIRIRIEEDLRQSFVDACRVEGQIASQVLRDFIAEYVERHKALRQPDLFGLSDLASIHRRNLLHR